MEKNLIYYHRAYRKITGSGWVFLIQLIAVTIPISFVVLATYPLITEAMSGFARSVLLPISTAAEIQIHRQPFLLGDICVINMPGPQPSPAASMGNALISIVLILLLPKLPRGKNIAIFGCFLAIIHFVSAVYFVVWPSRFPYTVGRFSELYLTSEIAMWLFIPFILGTALLLLPAPVLPKLLLILLTIAYSIVFGTLRYIIFLFVLCKFSIIYMALLFFAFGPLIDFVYIVGAYSLYTGKLTWKLKRNEGIWKWLY